jgi:CDP-diacylglycerol--serine O-phosphatidyltransferase
LGGSAVVDALKQSKQRHFSIIRDFAFADVITLGNGVAGFGSILLTLRYLVESTSLAMNGAMILLPIAGVFDFLDGRVARWRRKQSAIGAQLDSLADLISFGVAPAVVGYALGLRSAIDGIILVFFVSCGLSRLARYNVTAAALSDDAGKVRYFEGTPIPTSVGIVLVWLVLYNTDRVGVNLPMGEWRVAGLGLHPFALLYAISGSAMISKTLKIPKP